MRDAAELDAAALTAELVRLPSCDPPAGELAVAEAVAAVLSGTGRQPAVKGVSYYSDAAILLDGLDVPFCILGSGDLGMSGQADETASAEAIRAAVAIYVDIAERWLA
jgi:succinyl-diaminopimelate desuccinylase